MKNPSDQKLDMVPYFTSLAAFDVKCKIVEQVSLWVDSRNGFFGPVSQCEAVQSQKIDFTVEISIFQKNAGIDSRHVGWSKFMLWGPESGLEPIRTALDAVEVFLVQLKNVVRNHVFRRILHPKFHTEWFCLAMLKNVV